MNLSPEIKILLTAILPISELRGAIPLGILYYGMSPIKVYILSVIGNAIPVVPLLLLFEPTYHLLSKNRYLDSLFQWIFKRTRKRGKLVERYKSIGLMLFVAIPLPVTGAWTGALASFLFGIPLKYSVLSIFTGITIAGVIVTTFISMGIIGSLVFAIIFITVGIKVLLTVD